MPEGDTIFRAARTLHGALAGRIVTRFESVFPALNRIDEDHPIAGRTIELVTSRGKHLLIQFSGDLILRTHMRMNGSWHIYPAGARWQLPYRDMRILVATDAAVAVGFNVPSAELLRPADLARHRELSALGPDLLAERVDVADVVNRVRTQRRRTIADVLLDQRVAAGVGNVLKSEILFAAGIYPFTLTDDLDDDALRRIASTAIRLLRVNTVSRDRTLAPTRGRRTTGSLHPDRALWVYGRGGQPCRRCGSRIASRKTGIDARLTYWCPYCQRAPELIRRGPRQ